ncbi:MAG: tetratricopeptide repeat protein, partial [Gemmataceae bacterium]
SARRRLFSAPNFWLALFHDSPTTGPERGKDGAACSDHAQIDDGKPTWKVSHEVQYVIGSGTRGYSYFTELDGYVFQSPISWFTQKKIWDLSPGFKQVPIPGRSIHVACLQCHANRVKERTEYFQRFEPGVFDGLAIGCERCHGPGQKHVEFQESGALVASDFDHSIVNPARLNWPLRENVCEQCHLSGEDRILRRGRGWFDYRPGMPLEDFLAIFVKNPALAGEHKAVSHVEQMRKSKCFQGSQDANKMGCITCHDPHQKLDAESADTHYRNRCLKCHQEESCSLPMAERRRKSPGDACATCHMPKADSNIAHTALTEHGIIRPGKPRIPSGYISGANEMPIVLLHEANVDTSDPERKRDFNLAMLRQIQNQKVTTQEKEYLLPRVVTGLEEALRERPTDPLGWQVLAGGLLMQQRTKDTIQALERGLETMPLNEELLQRLAWMEEQIGKNDRAIEYWKRAVEVNPFQVLFRRSLGSLLAQKKEWADAEEQARKWIELEPSSSSAHQLLILCLLESGRNEEARQAFARLRQLHPPNLSELEAWFIRRGG